MVPAGLPCLAQADEVIGGEAGHGPADLAVVGRAPLPPRRSQPARTRGPTTASARNTLLGVRQPSTSGAVQPGNRLEVQPARCSGAVRRPASSCLVLRSGIGVVAVAGADGADRLPAASTASTVHR